nr:MAG TPA: hypothetical protein [Bacteriophage sp.]
MEIYNLCFSWKLLLKVMKPLPQDVNRVIRD